VIVATINFRVVGGPNNELVVPIGSSGWHWLFLAFTVNPGNQGQPPVVAVFANGELVYQASLNDDVIPSPGAPSIQMASALGTLLSWAFYTEAPMSEVFPALLQLQLKENAGAVSWSAFGGSPQLQHIYSASESMRPLSDVWADIGSVPNAPLTLDTEEDGTLSATVRSGDFASPAVGAIVDPSGPSGP